MGTQKQGHQAHEQLGQEALQKDNQLELLKYLGVIMKEVGVTNFLGASLLGIFLIYASATQKEKFISVWILFENDSHAPCVLVIVSVVLLSMIGGVYHRRMLSLAGKEEERLRGLVSVLEKKAYEK